MFIIQHFAINFLVYKYFDFTLLIDNQKPCIQQYTYTLFMFRHDSLYNCQTTLTRYVNYTVLISINYTSNMIAFYNFDSKSSRIFMTICRPKYYTCKLVYDLLYAWLDKTNRMICDFCERYTKVGFYQ